MMRITQAPLQILASLALAISVLVSPVLASTAYPEKPIRVVVPFPPGGATDSLARVLGDFMSRDLGQPIIVDNRSGAGAMIGAEAVVNASADGYTLLLTISSLIQAPHLLSKPPFDPVEDLVPVAQLVTTPLVVTVLSRSGITTPEELVARVKAEPRSHVYGSYGAGSSGHLYMHAFTEQTDLDWVHVPYRGEAPSVTDLLGGQITAVIMSGVGAVPHVRSGRMNALAVTGPDRMPAMPDVPTFEELGYERMSTRGWFGFFGPKGLDPEIASRVSDSAMKALQDPAVIERIENLSLIIDPLPGAEFAPVVKRDNAMWRDIIQEVGVQLD
ncbi:tripartite tricarboxylate transporter substrate binding protein [Alcanivorax sp. JB21]|uniref:Bug family tripartite tricarboxylate transporter substrate binding protein n=1 Tax=Alcanivorax limicola TaxID=2874102 RepID=UPI001CBE71C2|nr:tripartite tricarboxylate transporter substrate binding protein [Alcanivorax limicola]MBZ2187555.1 tripartite tricarboxylate transporter substrate binding protein [Alcanivorax limicola]